MDESMKASHSGKETVIIKSSHSKVTDVSRETSEKEKVPAESFLFKRSLTKPSSTYGQSYYETDNIKSLHSKLTDVTGPTSRQVKDNLPVPVDILKDLSLLINDEWKDVGRYLNIPEESLPKIQTDYGARQKEATYEMLRAWKEKMGQKATYSILAEALKKAGREDLAELSTELIELEERERIFEAKSDLSRRYLEHPPKYDEDESIFTSEISSPVFPSTKIWSPEVPPPKVPPPKVPPPKVPPPIVPATIFPLPKIWSPVFPLPKIWSPVFPSTIFPLPKIWSPVFPSTKIWSPVFPSTIVPPTIFPSTKIWSPVFPSTKIWSPVFPSTIFPSTKIWSPVFPSTKISSPEISSPVLPSTKISSPEISSPVLPSTNKINHFIRCLKAKYVSELKSMKAKPWIESGKFDIENLFVDCGLYLFNSSQAGSSWQPLESFQDLLRHTELRQANFIEVQGESGSGKTVLLHQMAHSWCKGEHFPASLNFFILLPCRSIVERYLTDYSICKLIKKMLLPRNTFLTVNDVRDILTNTVSVLALDDPSPQMIQRFVREYPDYHTYDSDIRDVILGKKVQLIFSSSRPTDTHEFVSHHLLYKIVRLKKWYKRDKLSYLQKLFPSEETNNDIILFKLGENPALEDICNNPLCFVLFVQLMRDDLFCEKNVTFGNLSQFFKYIVECFTKKTKTKQVEDTEDISKFAFYYLNQPLWYNILFHTNPPEVKDYKMFVDAGILEKNPFSDNMTPSSIRFCHSMFEMWFAAQYLSKSAHWRHEYEILTQFPGSYIFHSSEDMPILQRFICGLQSESSVILLGNPAKKQHYDNSNDDHFFLCFYEYCGTDDSLRSVVNMKCTAKREFPFSCRDPLVLRSMAKFFTLASQWKITIGCIDLRNQDLTDVNEDSLQLSSGLRLGPLSAKVIKIDKWCGKQFANFLKKCVNLLEIRIFASDYPGLPHEIQEDVEGATYKVFWEGLDGSCHRLEDGEWIIADSFSSCNVDEESSYELRKEMYVDGKGANIVVKEAGVSLYIPNGALTEGTNISVTVMNDAEMKLPVNQDVPLITPIVKCEPSGLKFQKPAILVLPHCGIIEDADRKGTVCFRGDCSGKPLKWETTDGDELSMSETQCFVPISHFSLFFCTNKQLKAKRMLATVFMRTREETQGILVKFWICNDDRSCSNEIEKIEEETRSKQIGLWLAFTLYKTLGNVVVTSGKCARQDIDFNNIWRGSKGNAFLPTPFGPNGRIDEIVYAKQLDNDDTSRIAFEVVLPKWQKLIKDEATCDVRSASGVSVVGCSTTQRTWQHDQEDPLPGSSKTRNNQGKEWNENEIVSSGSLRRLSGLLTKEWKDLGRELGLSNAKLEHTKSDDAGNEKEIIYQMLLYWKQKDGDDATYSVLFQKLKAVARKDLVDVQEQWITTECIDLRDHDIIDVNGDGLTLSSGVRLGPLSTKVIKINAWCGKQLADFLNQCAHLEEIRIHANDPRKRRHEIQREVEGLHFKVRWESNYTPKRESSVKTMEEEDIVSLTDLFDNLEVDSVSPVLSEILSTEMYVDSRGGRIEIKGADISLDIPPGALNEGTNISIAVVNDAEVVLPYPNTPMVTPLVRCKPSGQTFQKPVTLILPHCGVLTDGKNHDVICMKSFSSDLNRSLPGSEWKSCLGSLKGTGVPRSRRDFVRSSSSSNSSIQSPHHSQLIFRVHKA